MKHTPRPRIDLLQLHYFVAVVDAGSITKASRMCHIAQPALSKRISSLEEELGVQLLHRGAFGVQATEEGMILYRSSQRVLSDVAALQYEVNSSAENPIGNVRLGCQDSLTRLISRPLAKEVLASFPGIRLIASAGQSNEVYRAMNEGLLDLALIVYDPEIHNVAVKLLLEEELFVAGAPELFSSDSDCVDVEELAGLPFVFPSSTSVPSGQIVMNMLGEDTPINIVAMVDGDALKALIADGLGCCVLPWSFVQPEIESGQIVCKRVADQPMLRRIALCNAGDRPESAAARAVADLAHELILKELNQGSWKYARIIESYEKECRDQGMPTADAPIAS